ncbi:hypothetical protein NDU88_004878 [Pleurodeles waltl]|uniref:Uncharacterized protein n=1 Tax=Pleurodeles waltl TaxID=8319 RepID=A0AAV7N2Q2_PLEWA|nr:hypothetical protein NDU88_004878 [Pleurodeles waltl]
MPRVRTARDAFVTYLWSKSKLADMSSKGDSAPQAPEVSTTQPISQEYMEKFLNDTRLEIDCLKTDFTSCMQDLRRDITEVGSCVDDLERTMYSRTENQEMLWRRMTALEEQQIELQAKQEDLENHSCRNKVCIWGSPGFLVRCC